MNIQKTFLTTTYKNYFLSMDYPHSLKIIKSIYNKLKNIERKYVYGLYDAIYYCEKLKNKNSALHIQLKDNYLTDAGKKEYYDGIKFMDECYTIKY